MYKPIKKRPLYKEEIKKAITTAIRTGKLKPGDRIVETQWARMLGVSQSPVREAIQELEAIGMVENIPYKGAFVSEITLKEIKDSYKVRIGLEEMGIREAIPYIDDDDLKDLKTILEQMEEAAKSGDTETYIERDVRFHERIVEISGNRMLLSLWRQCNISEWTHIGTDLSRRTRTLPSLAIRHRKIYEALMSGDEDKAVSEVRQHLEELMYELDIDKE